MSFVLVVGIRSRRPSNNFIVALKLTVVAPVHRRGARSTSPGQLASIHSTHQGGVRQVGISGVLRGAGLIFFATSALMR